MTQKKPTGYKAIYIGNNRYKPEHRLVMEQLLGRPLLPEEHVHHINGDKRDNRPANLQLVSAAEHARLHTCGHSKISENALAVSCYDASGKLVKAYKSYKEAADDGHVQQYIKRCLRNPERMYHDMYWRGSYMSEQQAKHRLIVAVQEAHKNNPIVFIGGKAAHKATGIDVRDIYKCCSHVYQIYKGWIFRYLDDIADLGLDITSLVIPNDYKRQISACDIITCKELERFSDIDDAIKKHPTLSKSGVLRCCNGVRHHAFGVSWCWTDNLDTMQTISTAIGCFDAKTGALLAVYESAHVAGAIPGYAARSVSMCCQGGLHTYKGKHWKHITYKDIPAGFDETKIYRRIKPFTV